MLKVNPKYIQARNTPTINDEYTTLTDESLYDEDNHSYDNAPCDYDEHPEPLIYEDSNNSHSGAVDKMVELAKEKGIRQGLAMGECENDTSSKVKELINPNLALPAAYTLAKQIYDIERSQLPDTASVEQQIALAQQDGDKIDRLRKRLDGIIDSSLIGDPDSDNDMDVISGSGAESLTHAFHDKITDIRDAGVTDKDSKESPDIEQEDSAVICEALGQLCEKELAVRKGEEISPISWKRAFKNAESHEQKLADRFKSITQNSNGGRSNGI